MPLSDLLPVIDDRRFADIVAEVRTRIPRYTPEWTDLNESDPGMAMVEVFAWMTELLTYRLGKVPQLNYLKFLELVGFELTPARAATGEILFPAVDDFPEPYVIVPQGTQVAADRPDENGVQIVFETDRALIALSAALDAVQVFEQPGFRDVSSVNDQAKAGFDPFGPRAATGSALLLGLRSSLAFPEVEIDLSFSTLGRKDGAPMTCTAGKGPPVLEAQLAWEYWDGSAWRRLELVEDQTAAFTRSGHVRLEAPDAGKMVAAVMGQKTDTPRYWIRARLARSQYQLPPRLLAVRTNSAAVTEAQTVEFEILGGSDGRPSQVAQTTSRPVLEGTLVLEVDEGTGFTSWIEVPDFFGSGPDDPHYVLNRASGEIRFGDGESGRIPVANVNRRTNFRARVYRVGGGRRGNLEAGRLTSLMSSISGIDSGKVANLLPTGGGTDEESLLDGKKRAAASLKARDRAVTPEDFELLAEQAGGIARARALPLRHPDFPGVEVPGVVSVVVVPDISTDIDPAPMPNEATLRTVCKHLDARRLLTTELYVVPPRYRTITVSADIVVNDDADVAAVKLAAMESLVRYFDPLTGGEDSTATEDGTGWPFGGGVYYSLVMRRLLVDGVKRVASLTMQLGSEQCGACCDLALDPDMLLENGEHALDVHYDGEVSI